MNHTSLRVRRPRSPVAVSLALLAATPGLACRAVPHAPESTAASPTAAPPAAAPSPSAPSAPSGATATSDVFGAALDPTLAPTPLADIVAEPERFQDQRVHTSGTVAQVCQRMGCWMELRDGDGPAVRVPMAGHAFFLPRDAAGRTAALEGTVRLVELPESMRAHLESEGARVTTDRLAIEATGVVLQPR